jgi:hypothetical protein
LVFEKQWEDGLKNSEGWGAQDASSYPDTTSNHWGTINPDSSTADKGSRSGRWDLPAFTGGPSSAEILHSRRADPGVHDYYAEAFRFNDFAWGTCQGQPMSLAQYNFQGINGSALALSGQCGTGYGTAATALKSIYLLVNSGGTCNDFGTGCPYYSGTPTGGGWTSRGMPDPGPYYILPPGSPQLNVWYELIVHVYWTAGLDGVVEAWIRRKGEASFTKAFSHSGGFPTLQWGWNFNHTYQATPSSLTTYGTNDKIGAYRGPDANPLKLWQDNFCRATTFSAAASCLG